MSVKKVRVFLKDRPYDIVIGRRVLKEGRSLLRSLALGHDAIVITNPALHKLYKETIKALFRNCASSIRIELVPDSERAKSFQVLTGLLDRIAKFDKNKRIFIAAFGGGVIGDLAGFTAAIYK
ncbi:MAG: hypothetical protein PHP46_02260, partial [Candidatus Omnitrophica bacterium]|nr:hypothetical protein [Candidatus Omnitrophota bacterium]